MWCFANRFLAADEVGLINPAYMYCHYGQVSYPIHNNWGFMVVHPPAFYFAVGTLMRAGIPPQQAAGLICWVLLLALLVMLVTARLPARVQLAFQLATFFTMLTFGEVILRPEVPIVLAWLAGLFALENSRGRGWSCGPLALAGFCLALASGLHYWSFLAGAGAVLYLVVLAWTLPWRPTLVRAGVFAAGVALFAVPYLVYFLVPRWEEIGTMLRAAHAVGSIRDAHRFHLQNFGLFLAQTDGLWKSLRNAAFVPALALGISPIFLALAVLLFVRRVRLLALACCPLPLFVALFIQRKGGPLYVLPELVVYTTALILVGAAAITRLLRWVGVRPAWADAGPVGAVAFCVLLGGARPIGGQVRLPLPPNRVAIARAANRQLVGDDLLIMNNVHAWYSGGGREVFLDTAWGQRWEFFRRDLVTDDATLVFFSDWFGNQRKAVPFPHWYLDGHLSLRGFFLARERPSAKLDRVEMLTTVLVSPRPPERIAGYRLSDDGGQLQRFEADPDGLDVFLAVASTAPLQRLLPDLVLLPLPLENPAEEPLDLWVGICSWQQYQHHAAELSRLGMVREAVRGTLRLVDIGVLLAESQGRDQPIRFHRSLAEASAAREAAGDGPSQPVLLEPLQAGAAEGWPGGAGGRLLTTYGQDQWQLQAEVPVAPHTLYLVRFDLAIERGGAYVHAYDPGASRYMLSISRPAPQPEQPEAFVFDSGATTCVRLAVANNLPNGHPGRSLLCVRNCRIRTLGAVDRGEASAAEHRPRP